MTLRDSIMIAIAVLMISGVVGAIDELRKSVDRFSNNVSIQLNRKCQ